MERTFLDELDDSEQYEADDHFIERFETGLAHRQRLGMEERDVGSECPEYCHCPHHILKANTPPLVVGSTTRAKSPIEEPTSPKELERLADEILSKDPAA